jgi:methyl-accepting chemotaxis protein
MSTFQTTIDRIEAMQKELEAATGVTEVEIAGPPEGTTALVAGEFSCERLEYLVEEHMKVVTDLIRSKSEEIAALMSNYAPILSLPSDPLKILKWAKKVITGMVDPAISAAIELAIQIAQLAGALAGLVGAVASAAARLVDCISNLVRDTLKTLNDELMAGAMKLYNQAVGIYNSLKDQAFAQLGIDEIKELSDTVSEQIGTLEDTVGDIESSVDSMSDAVTDLNNIQIPGN